MPYKDGTGPDGSGPKKVDQGTPTPRKERRKDGTGKWGDQKRGKGQRQGGNRNR